LLLSDESVLAAALAGLDRLRGEAGNAYHFLVASEGGTHTLRLADGPHVFVRCWSVLSSTVGEAVGSSGSVEIPQRLIDGREEPRAVGHLPGTRRAGGLIASLTGGLETRRSAVAAATLHALASLFYGIVEGRPVRWR
jgi:non-canonical (house-cleaning) NTP pyrophosphatase